VWIFGHQRGVSRHSEGVGYSQIEDRIDSALTSVFTEEGKKAVLFYMTEKYSLSLEQASEDPHKLEVALTSLLGEMGWMVVKHKILEEFRGPAAVRSFREIEGASLRNVFGSIGSRFARAGPSRF
jgi:hypothetical protein